MSTDQERAGPAEGYGVVPIGNVWMPVKWADDASTGAYRPLQSTTHGAPDGVPQVCPTKADAFAFTWGAKRAADALLQPTLDLDVAGADPGVVTSKKSLWRPKFSRHKDRGKDAKAHKKAG